LPCFFSAREDTAENRGAHSQDMAALVPRLRMALITGLAQKISPDNISCCESIASQHTVRKFISAHCVTTKCEKQ